MRNRNINRGQAGVHSLIRRALSASTPTRRMRRAYPSLPTRGLQQGTWLAIACANLPAGCSWHHEIRSLLGFVSCARAELPTRRMQQSPSYRASPTRRMQRGHESGQTTIRHVHLPKGCSERAFTPMPTQVSCHVSGAPVTGIRAGLLIFADACDTALNGARATRKTGVKAQGLLRLLSVAGGF